jgi:ankyrin repeat protein
MEFIMKRLLMSLIMGVTLAPIFNISLLNATSQNQLIQLMKSQSFISSSDMTAQANIIIDDPETSLDIINGCDEDGNTPLMLAAGFEYCEQLEKLLNRNGCNIVLCNKHGDSALMVAIVHKKLLSVKILLDNAGRQLINLLRKESTHSPILAAIQSVCDDISDAEALAFLIIKALLARPDCDIFIVNRHGVSALGQAMVLCAQAKTHLVGLEIVCLLLSHGFIIIKRESSPKVMLPEYSEEEEVRRKTVLIKTIESILSLRSNGVIREDELERFGWSSELLQLANCTVRANSGRFRKMKHD